MQKFYAFAHVDGSWGLYGEVPSGTGYGTVLKPIATFDSTADVSAVVARVCGRRGVQFSLFCF